MSLGIFREVPLGDVLPVTAIVGERQRLLVENPDKTLRSAAMLDIGLAVGGRGREIHAVGLGLERRETLVDFGAPAAVRLDLGIAGARSLGCLDRRDGRGERDVAGIGMSL